MVRSWVREVNVKVGVWTCDKMRGVGGGGAFHIQG